MGQFGVMDSFIQADFNRKYFGPVLQSQVSWAGNMDMQFPVKLFRGRILHHVSENALNSNIFLFARRYINVRAIKSRKDRLSDIILIQESQDVRGELFKQKLRQ